MTASTLMIDGLRIALEMERRGRGMYARGQQITKDPAVKVLLKQLEDDETNHHLMFATMLEKYGAPVLSAEENALAAAKAADVFFPGGLMQLAMDGGLFSVQALIDEAIQSEKDAIEFYGKLLEHVPEDQREVIENIIKEEEKHHAELTARKEMINL